MLVLPNFNCQTAICRALIDATLLSLLVVPTLYVLFFKPMRKSIHSLEHSEKYQQELEKIDQIKSDFIAIAAHELCTPVSAIMGFAELLLEEPEKEQRQEYLEIISDKAVTLERIIDDLLILNRYEAESVLQINAKKNDLVKVVQKVANYYQEHFAEKPIHLDLRAESLVFNFDHIRISQVMDNLLSNAIKYDNDIHGSINITLQTVGDNAEICVRDEGIGMTPDELQQIYKKFFRAQTEKSSVGGLGLGMAIVKSIIESHNGTIDIVSQRGVGTTVTITLPLASI